VRRDVCHASTAAARADAAAVAREGDEQIVAAGVAVSPREALGKVTATDVRAKLLLDVARQAVRTKGCQAPLGWAAERPNPCESRCPSWRSRWADARTRTRHARSRS
jgi:hypothetical protein